MPVPSDRARHWDDAYGARGAEGVSWFQPEPTVSRALIRLLGVRPDSPVVDVGGGASTLVDGLLHDGFTDISVVDVSEVALAAARRRVGENPRVTWLHEDVLAWRPRRRFGLWHDRAVFHFLTTAEDRSSYLETMRSSVEDGGAVVISTFDADGPEYCSGLPVARYSADSLVDMLGERFSLVETRRELHTTPGGAVQPFAWVAGTVAR